jgi:hypothetical protein
MILLLQSRKLTRRGGDLSFLARNIKELKMNRINNGGTPTSTQANERSCRRFTPDMKRS